jgi:ribosomal protein L37AE/L43A
VSKIPIVDDSIPDQLQCTNCLLPMQYQEKKDGKFLWQCFKCGKIFFVSENIDENGSGIHVFTALKYMICCSSCDNT